MADTSQHFLRTLGSIQLHDATNQVTITATKTGDKKPSLVVSLHVDDSTSSDTVSELGAGWFAFVEDFTHVWVYDGGTLRLVHFTDKSITDSSSPEVDRTCPKEVRDALPESYRKKRGL
jgi:hypothetical protein